MGRGVVGMGDDSGLYFCCFVAPFLIGPRAFPPLFLLVRLCSACRDVRLFVFSLCCTTEAAQYGCLSHPWQCPRANASSSFLCHPRSFHCYCADRCIRCFFYVTSGDGDTDAARKAREVGGALSMALGVVPFVIAVALPWYFSAAAAEKSIMSFQRVCHTGRCGPLLRLCSDDVCWVRCAACPHTWCLSRHPFGAAARCLSRRSRLLLPPPGAEG